MRPIVAALLSTLGASSSAFSPVVYFDQNYARPRLDVGAYGANVAFTMSPVGAVTGRTTTITVKADGVHDVTVVGATLSGPGFDNTRNQLQTLTFSKTSGGYAYTVTAGAFEDLAGPVATYLHAEDADPTVLALEFDEELRLFDVVGSFRPLPAPTAFDVRVNGVAKAVAQVATGDVGSQLCLHMAEAIPGGAAVTVAFANPSTYQLQDPYGNAAPSFGSRAVANGVVSRTVVLLDDFTVKANGAPGAPNGVGPAPVQADANGGTVAISGGKLAIASGSGLLYWEVGATSYTVEALMTRDFNAWLCLRFVDANNHLRLRTFAGSIDLREVVAGVENSLLNADLFAPADLQPQPVVHKARVYPDRVDLIDYGGDVVGTYPTARFASATKVAISLFYGSVYAYNVKVTTPA